MLHYLTQISKSGKIDGVRIWLYWKNGLMNGIFKNWHHNSTNSICRNWKKDKRQGVQIEFK